jgi:hypothetical protein
MVHITEPATHKALDGDNRILWIAYYALERLKSCLGSTTWQITHNRWKQFAPLLIRQDLRQSVAHNRNQGIGRAKIDANRNAPLMGRKGHTGFRNL